MRKELKQTLENLVIMKIEEIRKKGIMPKQIILYTSSKILNKILVFNYTQNRFYNQQMIIDQNIPIVASTYYNPDRHFKEGDFAIDLGVYLKGESVKSSIFLDV